MKIKIIDDVGPENLAMLQALYSRSAASVDEHLEKVRGIGAGKFVEQYVVGYGHKSIADGASTTVFLEGVSMLAAKAIQDWALYAGQECSSRYIDMAKQPIVDPFASDASSAIMKRWMGFYIGAQPAVAEHIRATYPRGEAEDEKVYERAVKARVFDIMRGFLPAGVTTQLSWHTNLRQAGDHLTLLRQHPTREVFQLAKRLEEQLTLAYPSSGFNVNRAGVSGIAQKDIDKELRVWDRLAAEEAIYPRADESVTPPARCTIDKIELGGYWELLASRPRGAVLPHFLSDLGQLRFSFSLDFGSFRDIQRHRNGVCRMPILTTKLGFESWYVDQLPESLRREAQVLIRQQEDAIRRLPDDIYERQYYVALGFKVPCSVTYCLPAAVYVMELRSTKFVHPTLRKVVHENMVPFFKANVPGVPLHLDTSPNDWDVRRGAQTITEKVST